jgi:hypothetical protein
MRPTDQVVLGAKARCFAELLIDCEADKALQAVLIGMLRYADRGPRRFQGQQQDVLAVGLNGRDVAG